MGFILMKKHAFLEYFNDAILFDRSKIIEWLQLQTPFY